MANETKGSLILIPIPIAEGELQTLSPEVTNHTAALKYYFAENVRTARRFIRSLHPTLVLETIEFSEIDKHNGPDTNLLKTWLKAGHNIGILSESGCPGIADPGAELVAVAQSMG